MIRIEQFDVFGYQHLSDVYEFRPGLNVVTGPNESGKSTLHEALTVGLFGFSCEDRRRSGGVSPKDLRRPWSGARFGGVLTVLDGDGRRLRVRWDFESDLVDVTDCATGERVLREQPQRRTDYAVGHRLLGLSREDHRQLSCLFQVGLEPVRPSETLRQSLQRAVEATAGDGGVETADARLRALLSDLGVHAGHYGTTARGRLARTEADVHALDARLTQASGGSARARGAHARPRAARTRPRGRRRANPRAAAGGAPSRGDAAGRRPRPRARTRTRGAGGRRRCGAAAAGRPERPRGGRARVPERQRPGARQRRGAPRRRLRASWPRRAMRRAERTPTALRSARTPTWTPRTRKPSGPRSDASRRRRRPSRAGGTAAARPAARALPRAARAAGGGDLRAARERPARSGGDPRDRRHRCRRDVSPRGPRACTRGGGRRRHRTARGGCARDVRGPAGR